MINFDQKKSAIKKLAEKYGLSLVILYGSYAKNSAKKDSDIDIAVYRKGKTISFSELMELNNEFADIFSSMEMDIKSLHNTNSLFRYQVTRYGVLLYGRNTAWDSFRVYAFKDYCDSFDLLRLKEVFIKKRLKLLAVK